MHTSDAVASITFVNASARIYWVADARGRFRVRRISHRRGPGRWVYIPSKRPGHVGKPILSARLSSTNTPGCNRTMCRFPRESDENLWVHQLCVVPRAWGLHAPSHTEGKPRILLFPEALELKRQRTSTCIHRRGRFVRHFWEAP